MEFRLVKEVQLQHFRISWNVIPVIPVWNVIPCLTLADMSRPGILGVLPERGNLSSTNVFGDGGMPGSSH